MVRFLLNRPVAVLMTFLAVIVLGIAASGRLPVSLMPDIDIPEITVSISRPDVSSRELETSVVSILRRSLMQTDGVADIRSESRNGSATIRLEFDFGTDIDLAYMEVNEKIDAVMNMLPRDLERPRVIRASVADLPVFMLNISLDDHHADDAAFAELSDFAGAVIRQRIEQLPEVAMADISGQVKREISITPDERKMKSLGVTADDIATAVATNNMAIGSIMVKQGKYLYNLEFDPGLKNEEDIRNIWLKKEGKLLQIRDIATVILREQQPRGYAYTGDNKAIMIAIIKEASARMENLEKKMAMLVGEFRNDYPWIDFEISQDQTRLLDYALFNLKESMITGGLLAFFVMFFFLRDARSPLIIGISIPTTLVICLLFFYLIGLSINVVSLAGLILGIGMMIDNSIVIIENITQWSDRGDRLIDACVKGTNEVITPLISSVLTTCAVFVPLIFLSGTAGALFYDQAFAIIIGQVVSLLVGIMLLPTIYHLMYRSGREGALTRFIKRISLKNLEQRYESGMDYFFRHRRVIMSLFAVTIGIMILFFFILEKEKFPKIRQDEIIVTIDWNENIDLTENRERTRSLLSMVEPLVIQTNSFLGEQQFIFTRDYDQSYTMSRIYIRAKGFDEVEEIGNKLEDYLPAHYPDATISVRPQENLYEKIFSSSETPLVVEVSMAAGQEVPPPDKMAEVNQLLESRWPDAGIMPPRLEEKIDIRLDPVKMLLYDVNPGSVYPVVRSALNSNVIGDLRASHQVVPVVISGNEVTVSQHLAEGTVRNSKGIDIPVNQISEMKRIRYYKSILGNMTSEYVPVNMNVSSSRPAQLTEEIEEMLSPYPELSVTFSGGLISGQRLFRELTIVLLVSLVLLYFILAAQFESLAQPVVVLLEIPIDIAGALFLIWIWGGSINIMTMIGLIVMSGVIINDSILKVDTINNLRKEGVELKEAIYTGGSRRLKPIIMVAMASVFSTLPLLFGSGLGNQLERPMSLALAGGMTLGTFVSLYFIPLAYWYIYRKREK